MKTINLKSLTKKIFLTVFTLLFLISAESQAKRYMFQVSNLVPAARGHVKVNTDHNNNYLIKISISNLSEVSRLQPAKETYVVWMVTDQETSKNIGQLKSSKSFLSKKLKASFETVSSFNPTKIFITAEDNADSQYPGMTEVLSTERFQY
jgi:hypothetical protein